MEELVDLMWMLPREKGMRPQKENVPVPAPEAITMTSEMVTLSLKMRSCWMLKSFNRVSVVTVPPVTCTVSFAYCSRDDLMVAAKAAVLLPQTSAALK